MSGQITAQMVKELREKTGVGMGKCKEALEQVGGDMEKAIDFLRKAGIASAVKKEGRETKEGKIGFAETSSAVALVEINAETDFVTKNEKFAVFLEDVAQDAAAAELSDVAALLQHSYSKDSALTIDQYRTLIVQSLGENIQIKRIFIQKKRADLSIGIYSHMAGKLVTMIVLSGAAGEEELARNIAMHVAAESPDYLRPENVPADVKAREEEIAREQVKGKPANMMDKIIEGKMKIYYEQVCLLCQKYIKDSAKTIEQLVDEEAKRLGKPLQVQSFLRWKVGE